MVDTAPMDMPTELLNDTDACYRALASRDARFDGRFFVGVSSTGIYCRPVCKVRLPQKHNCTFYQDAATAEQAGFRPCLRCRPELSPGWSTTDISAQLALNAAKLIQERLAFGEPLTHIAARLGITDRHLRRVFEIRFGVRPVQYRQTRRLLLAKALLTDTALPITDIAFSSGFGSVRRFNAALKDHYGLTPGDIRGNQPTNNNASSALVLRLPVHQPYNFDAIRSFLASRAIGGLEQVDELHYQRTLSVTTPQGMVTGWIRVSAHARDQIQLEISRELSAGVATVLTRVRHLFDLDTHPDSYLATLTGVPVSDPGLRLPGAVDGFEIAVRAILGQQITVKAARTLAERFVKRFGARVTFTDDPNLTHSFPTVQRIANARINTLASLGIISRRAETIQAIARAIHAQQLDLSPTAPVDDTIKQLKTMRGIGDWTAQYIAMRALRWPDAFPAADYGIMKALGVDKPRQAIQLAEPWKPWRAYAVVHLWSSLNDTTTDKHTE